jgi:hypothetical protein
LLVRQPATEEAASIPQAPELGLVGFLYRAEATIPGTTAPVGMVHVATLALNDTAIHQWQGRCFLTQKTQRPHGLGCSTTTRGRADRNSMKGVIRTETGSSIPGWGILGSRSGHAQFEQNRHQQNHRNTE